MQTLKLNPLFRQLRAMPLYVETPNQISESEAKKIARKFGATLDNVRADFEAANQYGKTAHMYADLSGNGLGQYSNVKRLFFGYIYDLYFCAACESRDAARHEFQD